MTILSAKGISERNRRLLSILHRAAKGPFSASEVAGLLSLGLVQTNRFLAYLAERGWLVRIRRGLYATVPLDAPFATAWKEDPWVIATRISGPDFYVGGWTACEHWGLTEQLFRDTVVLTTRKMRAGYMEIQGYPFRVKKIPHRRMFGTRAVWRMQTRVPVSDPTHTIVDILDDPSIGGGMRHVREVAATYFQSEHRNDEQLINYVRRTGNRAVFKRLGYLVETLGIKSSSLLKACRDGQSAGISLLDPTAPRAGKILSRWNLLLNVSMPAERAGDQ